MEHLIDVLVVVGFACLTAAVVLWLERALAAYVWRQEWRRRWLSDGGEQERVNA